MATPPPTIPVGTTFNALAAITEWLTGTGSWSVSGRGTDGTDYTLTSSIAPGAPAVYPLNAFGRVDRTSLQTGELTAAGVSLGCSTTTVYFPDFSIQPTGFYYDADASCSTVLHGSTPSSIALVGASGSFVSVTDLDSCVGTTTHVSDTEVSWSIEAEGLVAYFCINEAVTALGSTSADTSSICIEVDTAGRLGTRAKVRLTSSGMTIEMHS